MLDRIRQLLKGDDSPEPLGHDAARVAIAALLVEAARADGVYDDGERAMIDRVLARRFGIGAGEAAGVRAAGEEAQAGAADLVRFTRAVKDSVPHEDRYGVIEAVWEVIYADGVSDASESALVRKLAGLLYVPDRDAGIARREVAERLGLNS
jgi:uncharacterized tellurite resistance protein B-like protein